MQQQKKRSGKIATVSRSKVDDNNQGRFDDTRNESGVCDTQEKVSDEKNVNPSGC